MTDFSNIIRDSIYARVSISAVSDPGEHVKVRYIIANI